MKYVLQYLRHPLRRIRAELYLRYYDKELSREELQRLYVPLKYDDLKRNHAVDAFVQGAVSPETAVCIRLLPVVSRPAVSFSTVSPSPLTAVAPHLSPGVPCHYGSWKPGVTNRDC